MLSSVRFVSSCGKKTLVNFSMKSLCSSMSSANSSYDFNTLSVKNLSKHVLNVELNRPKKLNAMSHELWSEVKACFEKIKNDRECRAVILSGAGKMFTAGLDFNDLGDMTAIMTGPEDAVRKGFQMHDKIRMYQDSFTAIELCPKPVIVAVHGACLGAGVDLIAACDIRYCSSDAYIQVKEVDVGLAADLGTLQRLPKIMGSDSAAREMIYTARKVDANECKELGIVSKVMTNKDTLIEEALNVANTIASKSPVAVQGSKINVLYSRDHSVEDSLKFNAQWNMFALQSEDLMKAGMAVITKSGPPEFSDL